MGQDPSGMNVLRPTIRQGGEESVFMASSYTERQGNNITRIYGWFGRRGGSSFHSLPWERGILVSMLYLGEKKSKRKKEKVIKTLPRAGFLQLKVQLASLSAESASMDSTNCRRKPYEKALHLCWTHTDLFLSLFHTQHSTVYTIFTLY